MQNVLTEYKKTINVKNTNLGNITVTFLIHFIYPEHCQDRLNSF